MFFYYDLCHSILLQDDKDGGGEGKGSDTLDIDQRGTRKIEESDEGKVCDVEVVTLIYSLLLHNISLLVKDFVTF